MELGKGDLRPAKVLKVVDNIGTIKVSSPGIFTDQDDPELLPPVFPLFSIGSNTFSTPNEGESVWLLSFRDNAQELFYFRMVDHKSYTKNMGGIDDGKDIECIVRKENDNGWGELYLDTGEGWVIANGDCKAVIDNSGNINLIGSAVKLGSDNANDPACKYNELQNAMNTLCRILSGIGAGLTLVAPQVNALITPQIQILQSQVKKIKSEKVYIER